MIRVRQEMEPVRGNALDINLEERAARLAKKLPPLAPREPSLTFAEMTQHADGCASELRCQAVELGARKRRGDVVHGNDQLEGALKDTKITKRFRHIKMRCVSR